MNQGKALAITLLPPPDVTLSGTLGVAFAPADDNRPWTGELPRVVTVDADYFNGPVLESFPFDPAAFTSRPPSPSPSAPVSAKRGSASSRKP